MDLHKELERLVPELESSLNRAASFSEIEEARVAILGRKGRLAEIMARLPELPAAERPALGQAANRVKGQLADLFEAARNRFEAIAHNAELAAFDPTLPGRAPWQGSLHPITRIMDELCGILERLGYSITTGPQVENDFHNFEALNMPPDHPARDMQDTLYISPSILLRTHTSPIQIRTMLVQKPPVAVVAPGKVYRRDSDITHSPMFHQIEGLLVDTHVTLADLHGTLTYFLQCVFGKDTRVRFRPSFFPFTEPSAEVDMSCGLCCGTGRAGATVCRVCKGTGWIEILGCGMVDPAVFTAVGYDPEEYTGFAFGLGVERVAMLKYHINDLRLFFENDTRFLAQFR